MSDWYYAENNEQRGPVLESELKALLASGKLPGESLVWKEGMANWTAASQVPALNPSPAVAPAATAAGTPDITPVAPSDIIGTPQSLDVDVDDAEKNKIFGIIAYLGVLCFVSLFAVKNSPFAKYHGVQGLTLFAVMVALWIVGSILQLVFSFILAPAYGVIGALLGLVWLGVLVLAVIGIINAAKGKCVPLPLIGGIRLIK